MGIIAGSKFWLPLVFGRFPSNGFEQRQDLLDGRLFEQQSLHGLLAKSRRRRKVRLHFHKICNYRESESIPTMNLYFDGTYVNEFFTVCVGRKHCMVFTG